MSKFKDFDKVGWAEEKDNSYEEWCNFAKYYMLNDILEKFSLITSETFLMEQSVSKNFLNVSLENHLGEKVDFSIKSPIYYLSDLNDNKILNIGTIYFSRIDEFLDTDENGYFKCKDYKNFHHIIAKNMMKIAIGLNCNDYTYLAFFKGYHILNAFVIGNKNVNTLSINGKNILLL